MVEKIKKKAEAALRLIAARFQAAPWAALPAAYRRELGDYLQRPGKRIRPILFVLGYLGFAAKPAARLYTSAAALELLHDFILIHDDIIDHAAQRRGGPALHCRLSRVLKKAGARRFTGADLAMIAGDALYTLAIDAFLAVRANPARKQQALEQLTRAALFTAAGELEELWYTLTPLARLNRTTILRIYDRKTACYSFALPLALGATLAGAPRRTVKQLTQFGLCLGRAFQIQDDLLDFQARRRGYVPGPPADIREGKRTLLLWFAYRRCAPAARLFLDRVYQRPRNAPAAIRQAGDLIVRSGALAQARREIERWSQAAERRLEKLPIRSAFRQSLQEFQDQILNRPL